ncbi:MAG: hypothetical protein AM325_007120 [Candidatus Thorarchaeota archaeon SMTZ1-45]|nr:MAG: hypothetical protein AM325_08850 [Candidatus Thorarchaeota archaeon SMTZ1-45]
MEPEKFALVSVTLVIVSVGMAIGVSFLTFPQDNDDGHNQLTQTTRDTDLLELGLKVHDYVVFNMHNPEWIS